MSSRIAHLGGSLITRHQTLGHHAVCILSLRQPLSPAMCRPSSLWLPQRALSFSSEFSMDASTTHAATPHAVPLHPLILPPPSPPILPVQMHKDAKHPFLVSGCKVVDGFGTMVVSGASVILVSVCIMFVFPIIERIEVIVRSCMFDSQCTISVGVASTFHARYGP